VELVRPELVKHFKPAFLGRLKVVPFYPITDEIMRLITRLKLNRIKRRMMANSKVIFEFGDEIVDAIAKRCTEVDSGARNVDHIMTNTLLPEMSKEILSRMANGEDIKKVKVALDGEGFGFEIS
jgi:type VI secretion system protein VasG